MKTNFLPLLQRESEESGGYTDWFELYQSKCEELKNIRAQLEEYQSNIKNKRDYIAHYLRTCNPENLHEELLSFGYVKKDDDDSVWYHICNDNSIKPYISLVCSRCRGLEGINFKTAEVEVEKLKLLIQSLIT